MSETWLFEGSDAEVRGWCRSNPRNYVYALFGPDQQPFYVGVGTNFRVLKHVEEARLNHGIDETNPHRCRKIRKIENSGGEVSYKIDSVHSKRKVAELREGQLILKYGRACDGGILTNIHPGLGTGLPMAPETLEKRAANLEGRNSEDPELRALALLLASISQQIGLGLDANIKSNPLKSRTKFRTIRHTRGTTKTEQLRLRSAAALAAVASCHHEKLLEGAMVPRMFSYRGISAILENGCTNDIVGSGVAEIVGSSSPENEILKITKSGEKAVQSILGKKILKELVLI